METVLPERALKGSPIGTHRHSEYSGDGDFLVCQDGRCKARSRVMSMENVGSTCSALDPSSLLRFVTVFSPKGLCIGSLVFRMAVLSGSIDFKKYMTGLGI